MNTLPHSMVRIKSWDQFVGMVALTLLLNKGKKVILFYFTH